MLSKLQGARVPKPLCGLLLGNEWEVQINRVKQSVGDCSSDPVVM